MQNTVTKGVEVALVALAAMAGAGMAAMDARIRPGGPKQGRERSKL